MNIAASLSKRHQFKQCWEFSSESMLSDYEKVTGTSIRTPFTSLPRELQNTLKSHKSCQAIDFAGKTLQRVKEVCVNNVKYSTKDVFVIDVVHTEEVPLFFQVKYVFNVDTLWILCGKLLLPQSFDSHFHAFRVSYDKDWFCVMPGEELDHQALDLYVVDDHLYVGARYA